MKIPIKRIGPKNKAAVELGRLGGKARFAGTTKAERIALAKKAVEARWAKNIKIS